MRNSFTKDKAGTLPFYMYTSINSEKKVDDQIQKQMEQLFQTACLGQEEDTTLNSGISSHSGTPSHAENGNESNNVRTNPVAHTAIYADPTIKSRSNRFSKLILDSMEGDKIRRYGMRRHRRTFVYL